MTAIMDCEDKLVMSNLAQAMVDDGAEKRNCHGVTFADACRGRTVAELRLKDPTQDERKLIIKYARAR